MNNINNCQPFLLVVEDSDEDFAAFMRITKSLAIPYPIERCVDGEEALNILQQVPQDNYGLPSVILLDLNLPGTDGREVLREIINNSCFQPIPTVVFTSSSNPKDIEFCYKLGVRSYIVKPINLKKLKKTITSFWSYWFKIVILPESTEVNFN